MISQIKKEINKKYKKQRRRKMAELIKMPKMGATMKEGTLTKWLVKEGDAVERGRRYIRS